MYCFEGCHIRYIMPNRQQNDILRHISPAVFRRILGGPGT